MCGPIEIFYFYMQGICLAAIRHFGAEAVAFEALKRGRGGRKQKSFSLFCVCNRRGGFLQIIKAPVTLIKAPVCSAFALSPTHRVKVWLAITKTSLF